MTYRYLKEDGSGAFLLEDGGDYYLLEDAPGGASVLWKLAPQNFAVAVNGQSSVSLSWTPFASSVVIGYYVWRDEVLITPLPIVGGAYIDAAVVAGRHYNYAVAAVDTAYNYGPQTPLLRADVLQKTNLDFMVSWIEQPGMAGRPDLQWTWR